MKFVAGFFVLGRIRGMGKRGSTDFPAWQMFAHQVLADEVRASRGLEGWMPIFSHVQFLNHPCHVATKGTHGLHTFFVELRLPRCLSIHHVPILRGNNRHIEDGEILVETLESC